MLDDITRCPACGRSSLLFYPRQHRYRCTDPDCGKEFAPEHLALSLDVPRGPPPPRWTDRAHREATRTVKEGDEAQLLPRLLAIAETLAGRLFPPDGTTLWR